MLSEIILDLLLVHPNIPELSIHQSLASLPVTLLNPFALLRLAKIEPINAIMHTPEALVVLSSLNAPSNMKIVESNT